MSDVPDMDEAPKVDEMDLVNILFAPSSIQALILDGSESNPNQRIDRQIEVHMRSPTSAWLVLFNDCTQQAVSTALPANLYVLDLMTNIYKEKEEVDDHGHLISVYYNYVRLDTYVQFEVIPSTAAAKVDLQALDFVLSQFTIKEDGTNGSEQEEYRANLLAKGLESSGNAVRQLLRSSGRCTGHVIRYLGATYTSLNTIVRSTSTKEVSSRSLRHAARAKQIGSGIHHSARTLTSTVLYPVRYLASTAVACNPNHTTAGSRSAVGQGLLDVTAGLGNGLTNICKGVTEAMGEMAFAIGDSALHHSRTMHGEQYAEEVTQKYLDACQEVGMAGYKVLNVSSFGVYGIMLDAIIEGSTLFISLYDYLIGPVILQGYMDVVQPPLLTVSRYFVVLRPWSISLYKSSEDFARKPIKIIVTSLLDTLPKLHIKDEPTPEEVVADEVRHAAQAQAMEMEMQDDYLDSAQLPSAEPTMQAEAEHSSSKTAKKSSVLASGGRRLKSILHNWAGGDSSHIELCTLDCSTYLLHPLLPAASDAEDIDEDITIETWYEELQKACKRVETIAKRKSGADDLAMERRLKLFPRSHLLQITVKRLVLNGRKVSGQPASRPLVDSKPEEVKEQEEVKVADDGQVMDVAKEELDRAALLKALEDVDIDDDFVIEDFTVADGALDEVWRSQLSDDESPSATPPTHGVKAEGSEEKAEEELPDAPKEVHQDSSFRRMKDNLVPISLIVIAAPVTQHGIVLSAENGRSAPAPLLSMQKYIAHLHMQLTDSRTSHEMKSVLEDLLSLYGRVDGSKSISDWEHCVDAERAHDGSSITLGRKFDLFHSGDCHKLELAVHSQAMYSQMLLGHAELAWDDLLFLTNISMEHGQQMGKAGATNATTGTSATRGPQEVWLPVIKRRTGQQIGSLLVAMHVEEVHEPIGRRRNGDSSPVKG